MKTPKQSLEDTLKKVASYKPVGAPKKPKKQPSKAELEQVCRFDGNQIVVE